MENNNESKIIKIESLEQLGDLFDEAEAASQKETPEQLPTDQDIKDWAMMLYKMKQRKNQ